MTYAKAAIFHRGNAITIMRARSNFNRAITRGFIRLFLPADAILHTRYLFSALYLQRFVQSASIGIAVSEKEYKKSKNHNYIILISLSIKYYRYQIFTDFNNSIKLIMKYQLKKYNKEGNNNIETLILNLYD